MIEFSPGEASFGADCLGYRVHLYPLHTGQIDNHAIITNGTACDIVAASTYCYQKLRGSGETDSYDDICHTCATNNESGPTIDHPVKHLACGLIAYISGTEKLATQAGLQRFDTRLLQYRRSPPA
jgi:hypothetical protein